VLRSDDAPEVILNLPDREAEDDDRLVSIFVQQATPGGKGDSAAGAGDDDEPTDMRHRQSDQVIHKDHVERPDHTGRKPEGAAKKNESHQRWRLPEELRVIAPSIRFQEAPALSRGENPLLSED